MESNDKVILTQPLYHDGVYGNPWPATRQSSFCGFLKWRCCMKNHTGLPDKKTLDHTLPVHKITHEQIKEFVEANTENSIKFLWIGHSTSLVNIENCIILIDPIFSERCSPSQYFGPKRFRPVPIEIEQIPRVDAVIISHNHYDHLDYKSCMRLHKKFKSNINWFVGMGVGGWFRSCGITENVHELTWWQEKEFKGIKFVFTIAQHWSARGVNDNRKTLWGSWSIIGKNKKFFFAGDTGYCSSFTEIGAKYGPFDLAAIPIGAYEPRSIMEDQHVDPEAAVQIHQDIKSKQSIGVHWATFALAYEYYLEPRQKLLEALQAKKLNEKSFITLEHGQSYQI